MCDHGFIGPCAECDGYGQEPELDRISESYADYRDRLRALERAGLVEDGRRPLG